MKNRPMQERRLHLMASVTHCIACDQAGHEAETPKAAASRIPVSYRTIVRLAERREVTNTRIGTRWFICPESLAAYLARRRAVPSA